MENQNNEQQEIVNQIYDFAANLMIEKKYSKSETVDALIEKGLDEESASIVVNNLNKKIKEAKNESANKNMLYGALWCVGGLIATLANFGFIFWGAIVFGAIQFFMGVAKRLD
jgi:hypothetical protein